MQPGSLARRFDQSDIINALDFASVNITKSTRQIENKDTNKQTKWHDPYLQYI